jgi:hypothetical protein
MPIDYRKIAISSSRVSEQQNEMLADLLEMTGEMYQYLMSGKTPTAEQIHKWHQVSSQIGLDLPAISVKLASITQQISSLLPEKSGMDS